MALTSYTTLKASIANWLNRSDLTDEIADDFIVLTEADFNKINWKTGVDSEGVSIMTTTNPHSEITWAKFKTEYDKL